MLSHDSVGRLCFLCWIPPGSSVQLHTAGDWQSWTVEDGLIHIAGSWCWLPHIALTSQEVLPAASHSGFWAVFQEDKGGSASSLDTLTLEHPTFSHSVHQSQPGFKGCGNRPHF